MSIERWPRQYGMHDPPTILLLEDVDLLHSAVLRQKEEGCDSEPDSEKRKRRGGALNHHVMSRRRGSIDVC